MVYRTILANARDADEDEIASSYNQRGVKEKIFDRMDNDFGWNHLPKSFVSQNAVFPVLTFIVRNRHFFLFLRSYTRACE